MTIAELKEEMKNAMRAKDSVALTTIRNVLSACTNEMVNLGRGPQGDLSDEEVTTVLRREVKKLKDSINQFTEGGRPELAEDSQAELVVLEKFLPALMSVDELRPIVAAKIAELGVIDKSGSGKLVGALMKDLAGKADGADVKTIVEELVA